ncbi:hypothetical protein AALA82_05700 [Oscillospiraceae bacterium 50-16]
MAKSQADYTQSARLFISHPIQASPGFGSGNHTLQLQLPEQKQSSPAVYKQSYPQGGPEKNPETLAQLLDKHITAIVFFQNCGGSYHPSGPLQCQKRLRSLHHFFAIAKVYCKALAPS